jgi:DNA-binding response OmpR family regulator
MSAAEVLVIEDDPTVARAIRRALHVQSVSCQVATSAEEVRASVGRFKVAIVDVNLPDGNGIDLYDELKTDARVGFGIFFTATEDEGDKARAEGLGTLIPKSAGVQVAVSRALQSLQNA